MLHAFAAITHCTHTHTLTHCTHTHTLSLTAQALQRPCDKAKVTGIRQLEN